MGVVIAGIVALGLLGPMDRRIHRNPVFLDKEERHITGEGYTRFFGKLMREGKDNLPCHAGIFPRFRAFRSVPERAPFGVFLWYELGQKNRGMNNASAVPVIVGLSGALVL
jgi:hypothetical protein